MAQEKEYIDAKDIAEFIEPEDVVLEGAPYLSGAWSPEVTNQEEAYNILSKYAPDFLSEIRANPQNYNLDSVINMASALKQQNAEAELKQHFGYAPEAEVPRDELMLKHRAQLAGFDPMNLPPAPSRAEATVGAFTGGATIGLKPFYKELTAPSLKELRRSVAPQQLPSEVTTGDVETGMGDSFRAMEPEQETLYLLRQYSPETYKRVVSGDKTLTQEEVNDAVNQATRKELLLQETYYPGTTFLSQLAGQAALNTGLAKVFGIKATQPWVEKGPLRAVLNPQALMGATEGVARGETPSEKLFGGFLGAVGGYTASGLGEPLGRKAADLGIGKAPLRGGLDVLAANRAQKRIDVLLEPEKAKALKTYLEDKALLKKEFEAMAASDIEKEIATRAKEIKAYKKALEDKVITKAEFEKLAAADIEKEIAKRAAAGDKAAQLYQEDVGDWQLAEAKLENVARKEFEAEQKNALREFQSTKDAEDALQAEALKLAREDLGVTEATARARQARTVALEESRGIFRKNAKIQERIDKLEARYAEAGAKLDDLEATVEGKVARYHGTELEKASRSREVAINLLDEKLARGEITEADAFAQLEQILKTSERDAEQLLKQAAEQVEAAKLGTTRPEMRAEKEVAKQKENLQNLRDTLKQKLDAQVALADKTTNTSTADPQVYQASLNRQLNDLQRVGLAVPSFDEVSARARELIDSGELAKRVPKTKQLAEIIQANRAKPAPMSYTPEAANAEIAKKLLANRERYLRENPELGKTLGKPSPVEVKRLPEWATEPPLSPEELRRRAAEKFAAEQEQYFFREPAMKAKLQSELPPAPDLSKPLPETVPPAEDLQKMAAQKFETEKAEYALREPRKMAKYEAPYVEPSEAELAKGLEKGRTLATPERVREGISFNIPFTKGRISFGETVPPESSVDISDKYLFDAATIAKQKAQKAMATPIAVPVAQSLIRTGVQEGVPAAGESFIEYLKRQQAEREAVDEEEKESLPKTLLKYFSK